mgnify:CR=1 FL=1
MKKKAVISTVMAAVILLILLAIILIYILGPEAILPQAAKAADWFAEKTFSGLRRDNFEKTTLESARNIEETYENILNILRTEGQGPCIYNYKSFSRDFDGYGITLSNVEQGIFVKLLNKNRQIVKSNTVAGKVSCVVGYSNSVKNFYNNYLDGTPCQSDCINDYSTADIEFRDGRSIYINEEEKEKEDLNLVFKTQDGNVCFIPTVDGYFSCSVRDGFLDDDCIGYIKDNIPFCSGEEQKCSYLGVCVAASECQINYEISTKFKCEGDNVCCIPKT